MKPVHSRMARSALRWTLSDLAIAAELGRATCARFELGEKVSGDAITAMRSAFENAGVQFVDSGKWSGAVLPPSD